MEEELRMAKEATVRLHDDLMRAEERRQRHQDDLDRVKNTLNESESRRLCLQNQYDNAQTEVHCWLSFNKVFLFVSTRFLVHGNNIFHVASWPHILLRLGPT